MWNNIFYNYSIEYDEQMKIVETINKMAKYTQVVYDKHAIFINFEKFSYPQPIYINVIRDPLERAVSSYYYLRFESQLLSKTYENDETRNLTYDECVLQNRKVCTGKNSFHGIWNIIPFFCGYNPICKYPSKLALQIAKSNVEKYYVAVGTIEYYDESLQLFEKLLPNYFQGIQKAYKKYKSESIKKYRGKFKMKPSEQVERKMKNLMNYEYQFYKFIRQRLFKMLKNE
ncbi:DgyrCDS7474 [Dimorphilus gyrociliatus]|uniref:DgyrCDS7474 n=1 Tax=Dimorphilus gyrociliatus TaxID=2664684 RepID=A0A7I8VTC7_9ANNE|nr:DgyrCDS7474 [Dimorphilus gyrociliatus]